MIILLFTSRYAGGVLLIMSIVIPLGGIRRNNVAVNAMKHRIE